MSGVMSSTGWRTRVETEAELFAELRSNALGTCAVFVIVTSGTNGVAVIVIVAVAPTASVADVAGHVAEAGALAGVGVASVICDGSGSITVTPVAVSGPRFLTLIVYVIRIPSAIGDGLATFVIARSAAITRLVTLAELLALSRSLLAEVTRRGVRDRARRGRCRANRNRRGGAVRERTDRRR